MLLGETSPWKLKWQSILPNGHWLHINISKYRNQLHSDEIWTQDMKYNLSISISVLENTTPFSMKVFFCIL